MKNTRRTLTGLVTMLVMVFSLATVTSYGQTKPKAAPAKDCCMMKGGKMMCMKEGKMVPMTKNMTMKDGSQCMVDGKCVMKDGKKCKMMEGDRMDMNGNMSCSNMHNKAGKACCASPNAAMYHCPMHKNMMNKKPGKCPQCKMTMVKQ